MTTPYNEVTREVNLDFFCYDYDGTRPELTKPFSIHDHSYATNGHWLVRVLRRLDVAETDNEKLRQSVPNVISAAGEPGDFRAVTISLPPTIACVECGGDGKEQHDCPCCECKCSVCDGAGVCSSDFGLSVGIGASSCQAAYIRHLLTLPNFRIAPRPEKGVPLWFSFDGGDGLLMPLAIESEADIIAELGS
jgi:hypothetical protein